MFLGDTDSEGSFHQEAPLRARCLAHRGSQRSTLASSPWRPAEGERLAGARESNPGAQLAASQRPRRALKAARN